MPEPKHKRILNARYREFLDTGNIRTMSESEFMQIWRNIRARDVRQARALWTVLYYTGCRPIEALRLSSDKIQKDGRNITILMPASKRGFTRKIFLPSGQKHKAIMRLWAYAQSLPPSIYLFHLYRGSYKRAIIYKDGSSRVREDLTDKLRYHVKRWTRELGTGNDITPYFLRHNRFSKLAEKGVSINTIRGIKGSKREESVMMYLHLSKDEAKKAASKMS